MQRPKSETTGPWVGSLLILAALVLLTGTAAAETWDGAPDGGGSSADMLWSTATNWLGDAAPANPTANTITFNNAGSNATAGTVTNALGASWQIGGMDYANTTGNTHTTDLAGNTLVVDGSFLMNDESSGGTSIVHFTDSVGTGTLTIGNGAGSNMTITQRVDSGGTMVGTLDLSAVANVNIDVDNITLSDISGGSTSATTANLVFGAANTVMADNFYVGRRKGNANVTIASGGMLNLGTAGDRANLGVAYGDLNTSKDSTASMDLSDGILVAYVDALTIGLKSTGASPGDSIGTLTLSDSASNAVDANSVTLGDWSATGAGLASGTITMGGGTFDVSGDLTRGNANGSGTSSTTVNVDGGAMTVSGNLAVDTVRVGYNNRTGTLTVDGTAQLGASGSGTSYIGRRTTTTGGTTSGTLDLSATTSFTADLDSLYVGSLANNSGAGSVTGTLKLGADNTINADLVSLGYILGGNVQSITGIIQLGASNTFNADTFIVGAHKGTGQVSFLSSGTLNLSGNTGATADLRIGDNSDSTTSSTATGTMDLSGGTFIADLGQLVIGDYASDVTGTGSGSGIGTLILGTSASNDVEVGSVLLGNYNATATTGSGSKMVSGTIIMGGGTFAVAGDLVRGVNLGVANGVTATSTVRIDGGDMTVGGNVAIDTLTVGDNSLDGSLTVTGATSTVQIGNATGTTDMVIGHRAPGDSAKTVASVDLSAAASFTANLDQLILGRTLSGAGAGNEPEGTLSGAATNQITANTIQLGDTRNGGGTSKGTIHLGTTNTVNVDNFYVGRAKSSGTVDIAAAGTLDLSGKSGAAANLYVGYNDQATGTVASGHFNMSGGGALDAEFDQLYLGFKSGGGSGNGGGRGTFTMSANASNDVQVNDVFLATRTDTASNPSNITGTLNLNGGSFTVTNSITDGEGTSTINVIGPSTTAHLTVGGTATVDTLNIGRSGVTGAVLDTSGGSTFHLVATNVNLGVTTGSAAGGSLILAPTSSIQATNVILSDSTSAGQDTVLSEIVLGTTSTTIQTDLLKVGGRKGLGVVRFNGSGTLALGTSGDRVDNLQIGYNNVGTATHSNGHLDGTGGTINAYVDNLVLGYHSSSSGDGTGLLTMAAGTFDVNNVTLADPVSSSNAANTSGTIQLDGGTIVVNNNIADGGGTSTVNVEGTGTLSVAGAIGVDTLKLDGTGTIDAGTINLASGATFSFLDGRLAVDTFNGNLLQQGGTLAPGNSPGTTTVNGDYTMNAGTLEIEIEGNTPGSGYDQLIVNGEVDLAGDLSVLVGGYSTTANDLFWILLNDGTDPITGEFASFPEKEAVTIDGRSFYVYYDADFDTLALSGGNDVLLTSVPEPSTVAMLLGLAGVGLLGYLRRRK